MKKIVNYKRFSKKLLKKKKSKRGADKPRWFVRSLVTFVKNKNKKKKLSIRSRKWVGVKQGKSS